MNTAKFIQFIFRLNEIFEIYNSNEFIPFLVEVGTNI